MRILLVAALLALALVAPLHAETCTPITISEYAYTLGVGPCSGGCEGTITWWSAGEYPRGHFFTPIIGERFNYWVPIGHHLVIRSALFTSKNLGSGTPGQNRSSYAEVFALAPSGIAAPILSIPEHSANPQFNPGLVVPESHLVYGFFINNSPWDEVMAVVLNGEICG